MSLSVALQAQRGSFRLQVEAQLAERGVTVLFGPSGAGKSSLLRLIAGLEQGIGTINFAGQCWQGEQGSLPSWQRPLGMLFQRPTLFQHLTVQGNLEYVTRRRGGGEVMAEIVAQTRIGPLLQRSVASLSGGEAQRVALARALLGNPKLLLLDEPLSALDLGHKQELLAMIADLGKRLPILYVTHSLDELLLLSEQVWLMEQGRIVAIGQAHQELARLDGPLAQRSDATALLAGQLGDYDGRDHLQAVEVDGGRFWLPAPRGRLVGETVRLRIAARDVSLCCQAPTDSSILNILPVRVIGLRDTGDGQALVQLALGEQRLLARLSSRSVRALEVAPGARFHAQIKAVALV